jgi:ABC-type Mn2+/Zn2+ transport system permease subunit
MPFNSELASKSGLMVDAVRNLGILLVSLLAVVAVKER